MSTMAARPPARTGKSFTSAPQSSRPLNPSNAARPAMPARPAGSPNVHSPRGGTPGSRHRGAAPRDRNNPEGGQSRTEHEILFQQFFKSVGPRTYVAQLKRARNGNHFLVLTEGKRDDKTDEIRKTRLFVFSEDFDEFFDLMNATADFVRAHPVPTEVKAKRERFWAKQAADAPRRPTPRQPDAAAR